MHSVLIACLHIHSMEYITYIHYIPDGLFAYTSMPTTFPVVTSHYGKCCWCMQLISGNTSAVASLRRKYNKLQGVALTLQNLLDDVATQLERLHACISWQDPSATLLFIGFCACAAMALALLGLPLLMATGFFWMVRPP